MEKRNSFSRFMPSSFRSHASAVTATVPDDAAATDPYSGSGSGSGSPLCNKSISTYTRKNPSTGGGESPNTPSAVQPASILPPSSPLRQKPISGGGQRRLSKQHSAEDMQIRGLWPSARKPGATAAKSTLEDHLNDDDNSLTSLPTGSTDGEEERPVIVAAHASSTFSSRQRISSESATLEQSSGGGGNKGRRSKENRPLGGSMRYHLGKLLLERSSKKPGTPPSSPVSRTLSSAAILPGRLSVDENALARRKAEFGVDFPSTESDRSETRNPSPRISRAPIKIIVRRSGSPVRKSKSPVLRKSISPVLRNSRSPVLGNSRSPVLGNSRSPVLRRRLGSPGSSEGAAKAASGSRRPNPVKERSGVGMGSLITMGLGGLFRRRSFSSATVASTESPSSTNTVTAAAVAGSPARWSVAAAGSPARGAASAGESQHRLRLALNQLIQWRFVNAKMVAVNSIKCAAAERSLVSTWLGLSQLQVAVAQKRLQLIKQKLSLKLNTLISPQIKALERWGAMEKQHVAALLSTKDSLHAVVCRLPLTDRAKADSQILFILLRQATNLAGAISSNIAICDSTARRTVPLVAQLAKIVAKEKTLIEECFELLGLVSSLQFQEESLRCHIIQLLS